GFMTLSGPDIAFTGTFNGNGNSISNFHYEKTSDMMDMIGIFGYVNGATISDVTVSRPEVDGGDAFSTGSLVGYMQSGTVTNCSVDGMIETSFVKSEGPNCGGLIGIASEGTLSNCSASIDVTCPGTGGSVGGLTGVCGANLSNCKAEGTVIGDSGVGGLAGSSDGSIGIEYCQTNSIVSGQEKVGGLVGITYSPIKQSFSTGSVTVADSIAGGLVGINIETTIEDCYSTADVTGVYRCGGLVGFVGDNAETALISNCYATGTISASHTSGSLVGQCFTVFDIISSFFNENGWDNGYGTPISTAEMQTQTTFTDAGWDFVVETANGTEDIWKLYHPQTYPKLSWEKYGGTGTLADPFLIYSPEEMNAIGANPDDFDKCFKLMADIDLSMYTGSSFNMIGRYLSSSDNHPFEGIFDGNGHTISSFTYTTTSGYVGLFSYVSGTGARADIRDLTLTGVNINSSGYNTGGLVGHLGGVVSNCSVEGTVTGGDDVGGLVGDLYWGSIYDCSSTGSVNGDEGIGGLVGDCYVGEVINCYSTSSVTGNSAVGGLAGEVASSKIYTCYAAGIVSGTTDVGGFAGFDDYGFYTSCFWNQTVNSGLSGIGNAASSDVVGHTTLELQTANTFTNAGWDFAGEISNGPDDDWGMPSGGGYPELWWQLSSLPALPAGLFSSGSGTLADPYLVSNATELNNIGRNPQLMDKHFKLVSDIDLKGTDLYMIGGYSSKFNGVFDGGGHKVSNFTKDTLPFGQRLGFFQAIDTDGCVESLSLTDPNVGSEHILHSYNGGFASSNYGTIKNCMVSGGDIKSYFAAGGIAGTNAGTITNCYSSAMTTAENISGGLVGFNAHGGLITKSVSAGKTAGDYTVGGIAGTNLRSTVSLGHSLGDITGIRWIGGIVGENHGTVVNCYSQSKITSSSYSGGIVGTLWAIDNPASVLNCYSAGVLDVAGTYGGTIGADFYGTVENCFFDSSINPGISGSGTGPDPDNAIGLSAAEMQTASTFITAGWDFYGESGNGDEDLWIINEGYGYPVHFWERVNLTGWFGTDLADFAVLSSNWQQGCNLQCNKCDIIEDGSIDFRDFAVIMANWSQADCDSCGRADLSGDGNVTILDVQEFAECWLDPYDCLGSDIDFSGQVDISDLLILAEYWLE
ncbi:MAG: hypothetical protein JW912_02245, partial [Sedimentisphaerales bacterium]|nr:hypothetical protein [Sedimentisphaerales bacterium]